MLNVAVTGNAGAGKSTVVKWFREWGATVIDADAIVRELQEPGSPVYTAIVGRFGPRVVRPDGTLDRAALRRTVLRDDAALASLNGIVHPAVKRRRDELAGAARARGDRVLVNDIPLLFEVLDPDDFDLVVLVDAPVPLRRERLVRERRLPASEADRLMAAQLPADQKRDRSDIVIDNDGSLSDLHGRARAAWESIVQRDGAARSSA